MLRREIGLCLLSGAAFLAFFAETNTASAQSGKGSSTAVPSNYRQQIAAHIRARFDRRKVLKAEISRPGVWEGPWGLGGSRPFACAKWLFQGPWIQQNMALAFTFENGKIAETFDPGYVNPGAGGAFGAALKTSATCGKASLAYSRFPEIVGGKK
jgi:hypothetical protein